MSIHKYITLITRYVHIIITDKSYIYIYINCKVTFKEPVNATYIPENSGMGNAYHVR